MGASEHLPFPVPSKKSQPSTTDWVFAICRFYWSKSVLGGRPCIGSVSPRRLGWGGWVGGGPFSGQQLCLWPDMTSSNHHLPLEHCRRNQNGSQVVMGTADEKGRKTSEWLTSETAKAPPWGGRLCASKKESNSLCSLFSGCVYILCVCVCVCVYIHTHYTTAYIYKPAARQNKSGGGVKQEGKWIPILGNHKGSFVNVLRCQVERCQAIWISELVHRYYEYGSNSYY